MADECAVKHCEEPATLGMTWRFNNVRIEFYVCERHFDEISAVDEVGPPDPAPIHTATFDEIKDQYPSALWPEGDA